MNVVEKVLGVRFENRENRSTKTYDKVNVIDNFAYVPILEKNKTVLRNPNLFDMFTSRHSAKDMYFNLNDGLPVTKPPLFFQNKNALQIQLIFGEFVTAHPLGSEKGICKLRTIYCILHYEYFHQS